MLVPRLCEKCDKEVKGKLFKGMCRRCYDKSRVTTVVSIPKKIQPLFEEYAGERDDKARCICELVKLGLNTWKHGKWVRVVPRYIDDGF
jgi:hypothetical protein